MLTHMQDILINAKNYLENIKKFKQTHIHTHKYKEHTQEMLRHANKYIGNAEKCQETLRQLKKC